MGKNLKILIAISVLVALVCYIYYLNPQQVELTTRPGVVTKLPLAILILSLVLFGAIISALASLVITTKLKLKIWSMERNLEKIASAENNIRKARGMIALDKLDEAISLLKKVVHDHQFQHSARALLTKTLKKAGKSREALELLSSSRIENADTELLILFAEINIAEGNSTAAYDNLVLVLKSEPHNLKALEMIVTAAENIQLLDEAISFQEQKVRNSRGHEKELAQHKLAELELKRGIKNSAGSDHELLKEVERILQRHRDFAPALKTRAGLSSRQNDFASATKDLKRAYEVSQDTDYMVELIRLCLKQQQPHEALAAIESFTETRDGVNKYPLLQLLKVQLLLHLEMVDAARELTKLLRSNEKFCELHSEQLLVLESLVAKRVGKFERAVEKLSLLESIPVLPGDTIFAKTNDLSDGETNLDKNRLVQRNSVYAQS